MAREEKPRIIFVGLHNKPEMKPLDILTKSGKLINRIIKELPQGYEIIKSNLFNVDYFPIKEDLHQLAMEWYWTHLPVDTDIVVLLGATVHNNCPHQGANFLKVAHPASKRSHADMDDYVMRVSFLIKNAIKNGTSS